VWPVAVSITGTQGVDRSAIDQEGLAGCAHHPLYFWSSMKSCGGC